MIIKSMKKFKNIFQLKNKKEILLPTNPKKMKQVHKIHLKLKMQKIKKELINLEMFHIKNLRWLKFKLEAIQIQIQKIAVLKIS
jgi:hypothetical protein